MDRFIFIAAQLKRGFFAFACLSLAYAQPTFAATCTWVGSAGTSAWSATANWSGSVIPSANSTVTFSSTSAAQYSTTCDIAELSVFQIVVTDVTSAVTVSGTIATLGASGQDGGINMSNAKSDLTVTASIGMSGTSYYQDFQTWTVAASRTLIVSGAVKVSDGTSVIRKKGTGFARVAGNENNDNLLFAVAAGTLELAKASGECVHATFGITGINSGATLRLAGSAGDQIDDAGAFGITGVSGTFDLNSCSETIGKLQGDSTSGVVTNSGSTANSVLTVANSAACTFAGKILDGASFNVGLTKSGTATLTLDGTASTYSGVTRIENGTLAVSKIANAGTASTLGYGSTAASGEIEIDGSSLYDPSLQYTGTSTSSNRRFALGRGSVDVVGSAANLQLTGAVVGIASASACEKLGAGTLTLGGTSNNDSLAMKISAGVLVLAKTATSALAIDATGDALTISGGTAQLAGSGGDQINDSGGVVFSGGTFDLNGRSEAVGYVVGTAGTVTNSTASTSTLTISGFSGSKTFSGLVSGSSSAVIQISKCGSGEWILSNDANAFYGGVMVSGGTLSATSVANSGTTSALGKSGTITLSAASGTSATLQFLGASGTTDRVVRIAGSGTNAVSVVAGSSLTFSGSVSATSNGYELTKSGNGLLTLQGTANNSLLTLIAQCGTVSLAKTSSTTVHSVIAIASIADSATVQLAGSGGDQILDSGYVRLSGGTFDLNGKSETIDQLLGDSGTVTNGASAISVLTVGASGGVSQFSGDVTGNLKLVKTGVGSAAFDGTISASGGVVVAAGELTAQTISAVGSVTVNEEATLIVGCLVADSLLLGGMTAASANETAAQEVTAVPEPNLLTAMILAASLTLFNALKRKAVF